jgi:outer membrane protein TolC
MNQRLELLILLLLCLHVSLFSQDKTLGLEQTLDIIRKYHPVARQANLEVDMAKASLQSSRGAFDPAFYLNTDRKTFNGQDYYFHSNPELKIPTWFGIDIKAGVENNFGQRLAPDVTTNKSSYVGVIIPIFKGLLFDQRRAMLKQSKLMVSMSSQARLLMLNDLLIDAADAYWKWVGSYQSFVILTNALNTNKARFELVRKAFISGDRAAIDTTEALAQLQSIEAMQNQSWYEWQKARLMLSNFLWKDNNEPYELSDQIIPDPSWNKATLREYPLPNLVQTLDTAIQSHPKLLSLDFKMDILELEKRLKFQSLLPKFDVNYNFLNSGYAFNNMWGQPLFNNNFKYGVLFSVPLLQRAARGDYKLAGLKINDLDFTTMQTRLEISNKVKASYNEMLAMQKQSLLFQDNVLNQQALLKAEEMRFSIGESSMFLVNARENKLLETSQKMVELKTKFFKSLINIQWAAGQLR